MHRRRFFSAFAASSSLVLAGPVLHPLARASAPACGGRTESNIEGPYHRPGAPLRDELAPHASLTIGGTVRDRRCRPLAGAVMDFWQADQDGDYDLQGFAFRGQLRTNEAGQYSVRTLHPGRYRAGGLVRPAHIHVKVHANGHAPLTTQLYFLGDPHNETDPWFRSSLVLREAPRGCCSGHRGRRAHFDFVL